MRICTATMQQGDDEWSWYKLIPYRSTCMETSLDAGMTSSCRRQDSFLLAVHFLFVVVGNDIKLSQTLGRTLSSRRQKSFFMVDAVIYLIKIGDTLHLIDLSGYMWQAVYESCSWCSWAHWWQVVSGFCSMGELRLLRLVFGEGCNLVAYAWTEILWIWESVERMKFVWYRR